MGTAEWGNTTPQPRLDLSQNGAAQRKDTGHSSTLPERLGVARLLAVGIGGGGTNAVNRMIEASIHGVEFVAMNTDVQALEQSRAKRHLRLGETLTRGLGAGGNPEVGRRAAEESLTAIREVVAGVDMVFVTAGMGGGTGTGAAPLVAQAAREQGALTVAVVTTPFAFERRRKVIAEQGLVTLRDSVDALIIVPNERLMQLAAHDMSAFDAYRLADDVLRQGIQGISDLITVPGLINLDFADIKAVMSDAGSALMSMGQASGENRAEDAAHAAITNPLLDVDITGARGVVFNITGGEDMTMYEVNRIADIISGAAHPEANIIFGTVFDAQMADNLKVTVVSTGFEPRVAYTRQREPWPRTAPASAVPSGPGGTPTGRTNVPDAVAAPSARAQSAAQPQSQQAPLAVQQPVPPQDDRYVRASTPAWRDSFTVTPVDHGSNGHEAGSASSAGTPSHVNGDTHEGWPALTPVSQDNGSHPPMAAGPREEFVPGFYGDEFYANEEEEETTATPGHRSRWERLFNRR